MPLNKLRRCECAPDGMMRPVVSVTGKQGRFGVMVYCANCGCHTVRVYAKTESMARRKAAEAWSAGKVTLKGPDTPSIIDKSPDWVAKGVRNGIKFGSRAKA